MHCAPSSAQMSLEILEIRSLCSSSGETLRGRAEEPCCAYVIHFIDPIAYLNI